jgi:protein-L-isoaspartate(D-aspartate) O-methyltransferase
MTDAARQRTNMVESQILTSDVTDRRILQAMGALPRERFVPAAWAELAYMDEAIPLSVSGRMLMAPRVFAKLLQLAEIGEDDRILDIGSGSGYSTAVLAKIAKSVVGLECDARLAEEARLNLAALSLNNRDYKTAEENFRAVLQAQPKNYEAAIGLGVALRGGKKIDEGDVELEADPNVLIVEPKTAFTTRNSEASNG